MSKYKEKTFHDTAQSDSTANNGQYQRRFLMKDGKIVSDIDVHAASLSEINEKMSLIYDNINVIECTDINHKTHRVVVAL